MNYASDAGHLCLRYLYFSRVNWEVKQAPDVGLQFIFARGRAAEQECDIELKEAGFHITEHERPYEWQEQNIRGKIDRMLLVNGVAYPCEYKTLSPFQFDKINSVQDMLDSDKLYLHNWPAQLLLYQLMSNSQYGLFYIKNSLTWYPKEIWSNLYDYLEYAEHILDKLERVNHAVEHEIVPIQDIEDTSICRECPFFLWCNPDIKYGAEGDLLTDPELLEDLEERERLEEGSKRFKQLDKKCKARLEGVEKAWIGDFSITGHQVTRHLKAQEAKESSFWQLKIRRL